MAKDDLFVIIYQVLKYLYDCLKKGESPEPVNLTADKYSIPENYWSYILINLYNEGYIKGIKLIETKGGVAFGALQNAIITIKGVEYLFDNSLIQRAMRSLKDIKDVIPFA